MTAERRRGRLLTAFRAALYPAFEPADRRRLKTLTIDAQNARGSGNLAKAEQLYLTAIREAGERPRLASYQHSARTGLALVYKDQGRFAEAESIYLGHLAEAKGACPPNSLLHAACIRLAELYNSESRYDEAEKYYEAALAETEKQDIWQSRGPFLSTSTRVAQFYVSRGNYSAAEALFMRAIQIVEMEQPRRDSSLPHHLSEIAKFYQDQGRHPEAEEFYRKSVLASEKFRGAEDPMTVQHLYHLGAFYRVAGKPADAEAIYRRALATADKAAAEATAGCQTLWKRLTLKRRVRESFIRNCESSVGTALDLLAACFEDQQKYAEAEPLRRRSLEIVERGWGKVIPHLLADALESYATLLRKLERSTEAEQAESRARPIRAVHPKGGCRCEVRVFTRPGRLSLRSRLRIFMGAFLHPPNAL